jgi:hypothetical protein
VAFRRKNKYGAKKRAVDGYQFHSVRESERYEELKLLQQSGLIRGLVCQVPFELHGVDGSKVCTYIADFMYWAGPGGNTGFIHEVKGYWTPLAKLKKKLFLAEYGKNYRYVES